MPDAGRAAASVEITPLVLQDREEQRIPPGSLTELATAMPVVLASRIGSGPVLTAMYGFAGSESDLLSRGLIGAGALDCYKARVLLHLLLTSGTDRGQIAKAFEILGAGEAPDEVG